MGRHGIWYIRRGRQVKGPFPAGQISQYLVLGRMVLTDEVSQDRETWRPVGSVPDLVPEVLRADPDDPEARERLEAARRWADERRGADAGPWSGGERRAGAAAVHPRPVPAGEGRVSGSWQRLVALGAGAAIMALAVWLGVTLPSANLVSVARCDAPPAPGVNWSYCRLSGLQAPEARLNGALLNSVELNGARLTGADLREADLSYADLSNARLVRADLAGARLKGASLRGADLAGADLRGADLSYADLGQARLEGALLEGARLDHAVWTDGRRCRQDSRGTCLASP